MAVSNKTMRKAKGNKKDEFYTQKVDIRTELEHYKGHFAGKSVGCPCDDYRSSKFCECLEEVKEEWGITKLVFTCYVPNGHGLCRIVDADGIHDFELEGDGSYDSEEVSKLLEDVDIITTNPPFSLFKEFVNHFIGLGKEIHVLGTQLSIYVKEIYTLYRQKKLWLGYTRNKTMLFEVPNEEGYTYKKEVDGKRYGSVAGISWWSSLGKEPEMPTIDTKVKYSPDEYEIYENFDALHVPAVSKIPMDYDGLMGVPGTYIGVHDDKTFEVVGILNGYGKCEPEKGFYCGEKLPTVNNGKVTMFSGPVLKDENGDYKAIFGRILIKNRKFS